MAITEPLVEVECVWCEKIVLMNESSEGYPVHCHHCDRLIVWTNIEYMDIKRSRMVTQNTMCESVFG